MRKAFTLLLLLFAAALVAGGVYLIQRGPQGQQGAGFRGAGPVSVEVATVGYDQFADEIEAIGTAIADESVTITARVSESVEEVHFDDGDRVEPDADGGDAHDNAERDVADERRRHVAGPLDKRLLAVHVPAFGVRSQVGPVPGTRRRCPAENENRYNDSRDTSLVWRRWKGTPSTGSSIARATGCSR